MTHAKRVLGGLAAVPFVVAGAAGVRSTLDAARARRRGMPLVLRCPDARTHVGPGRRRGTRHAHDPSDGCCWPPPVPPITTHARPPNSTRPSRFYADAGWLDDPAGRHPAPDRCPFRCDRATFVAASRSSRFDSGWDPVEGEPGGERWRSFDANRVVTVRLHAPLPAGLARGSSPSTARAWAARATSGCSASGDCTKNSASTSHSPCSRCTDPDRRGSHRIGCSCRTSTRSTTCSG